MSDKVKKNETPLNEDLLSMEEMENTEGGILDCNGCLLACQPGKLFGGRKLKEASGPEEAGDGPLL